MTRQQKALIAALFFAFVSSCMTDEGSNESKNANNDALWLTVDSSLLEFARTELSPSISGQIETIQEAEGIAVARLPANLILEVALLTQLCFDCGGFMTHNDLASALDALENSNPHLARFSASNLPSISLPDAVAAVTAEMTEPRIADTIRTLSAYQNRLYNSSTGVNAAEWLAEHWQDLAAERSDTTVTLINHSFPQPSVEMKVTGTASPDEYVVIGGHLDSIAGGSPTIAPGADDNASGVAVTTEVARAIFESGFRPERTILFYGYAGEEVGLLGSQDIAERAADDDLNIVGVLNLDLVNFRGESTDMAIIGDYTDSDLNDWIAQLVDMYIGTTWTEADCGYACSDHASWSSEGFPSAFLFEAPFDEYNPYIHTADDTIAACGDNANHALMFAQLAGAFVVELAKGSVVDQPVFMEIKNGQANCGDESDFDSVRALNEFSIFTDDINIPLTSAGRSVLFGFQTGGNFHLRARAYINIQRAGTYTFAAQIGTGDSVRVDVGDQTPVPWRPCSQTAGVTTVSGDSINLTQGNHMLEVLFSDDGYKDALVLMYSGPDTNDQMEVVPPDAFARP